MFCEIYNRYSKFAIPAYFFLFSLMMAERQCDAPEFVLGSHFVHQQNIMHL